MKAGGTTKTLFRKSEISKILLSKDASNKIRDLHNNGILAQVLPEFDFCFGFDQNNPHHIFDVAEHTLAALDSLEPDVELNVRLAILLHDIGKPFSKTTDKDGISHFIGHAKISVILAEDVLKRFEFDNDTMFSVLELIGFHDVVFTPTKRVVRRLLNKVGIDTFNNLTIIRIADALGQHPNDFQDTADKMESVLRILDEVIADNNCFKISDLAINGNDLIELGFKQGKNIGIVLTNCLEIVLEDISKNERKLLLDIVKEKITD